MNALKITRDVAICMLGLLPMLVPHLDAFGDDQQLPVLVQITFDDVPSRNYREIDVNGKKEKVDANVMDILDALSASDVKAIFFVCGSGKNKTWWDKWPMGNLNECKRTLYEIVKRGHFIGNHLNTHPDITGMTEEQIKNEIIECHELVKSILRGYGMTEEEINKFVLKIVRFPYLANRSPKGSHAEKVAKELGYTVLNGELTRDTWPWVDLVEMVKKIVEKWKSPEILVLIFHANVRKTCQKIPDVLRKLKDQRAEVVRPEEHLKKLQGSKDYVRSIETLDEHGNNVMAVEAAPTSAALVALALPGAMSPRGAPRMRVADLLPTSGPSGTTAVGPLLVPQASTQGNAEEGWAVEFRSNPREHSTTQAAVMILKTRDRVYLHDYAICARFHGLSLRSCVSKGGLFEGNRPGIASPPWFWFCSVHDEHTGRTEIGVQFAAFVDESRRELTIDSRWIDKQYCPHWRGPSRRQYDYVLNFQIWSYASDQTDKLLRDVFARLGRLGEPWKLAFANRDSPTQPSVFVSHAWHTGSAACLFVVSHIARPSLACFHGTKRTAPVAPEEWFEQWAPVYPGENLIPLRLGQIHNAVIHCEVAGFMDKVFVSVDKQRPTPWLVNGDAPSVEQRDGGSRPKVAISWPSSGARVAVLRDQLDMPDDDDGSLVAIHGTVTGAPFASTLEVWVHTDQWYRQDPVTVRDGLWGVRVRLSGRGAFNNHSIYVRLRDANGREIASDRVDGIIRIDSVGGAVGVVDTQQLPVDQVRVPQWNPIVVEAKHFQAGSGCHRETSGVLIIGGSPNGPSGRGGSASCRVDLIEDASKLKLRLSVWHGMPSEFGKGVHSARQGGTVTVYINDVPVHRIICRHRGMYGDYWPEEEPELGRQLPEIDLASKGFKGRTITIKFVASPWTCMDLRSVTVEPKPR